MGALGAVDCQRTVATPGGDASLDGPSGLASRGLYTHGARWLARDDILRHGIVLTAATGVLNVTSWLYHVVMSRALGPTEYGALSALVSALLVLTIPANTIQMGVSAFVARVCAAHDERAVVSVLRDGLWRFGLLGAVGSAALVLFSGWLASALRLVSPQPVIILATVLIPWTVIPLLRGVLQGLHRFAALGASLAAEGVLKLSAGVALVALGWGVAGAVGGVGLGALGALALTLLVIRRWLPDGGPPAQAGLATLLRSLLAYTVVMGCFTVLTQADVVLVKALFPPHDAGVYAAASAGGKVVLYLTGALPMVILPETARLHASNQPGHSVLARGLAYGGLAGGVVVATYFVAPLAIIRIMFGDAYDASAPLTGPLALGMLGYALALISLTYCLATRRLGVLPVVAALTVLFPVLLWLSRGSIGDVARVVTALGLLTFGVTTWSVVREIPAQGG